MKLRPEAVEAFQTLYKKKYGVDVSYEEASRLGLNLIRFLQRIGYFEAYDRHHQTENNS